MILRTRKSRVLIAGIAVACACAATAACSSGGGSAAAGAAATQAGATQTGASTGTIASAQQYASASEQAPTSVGVTVPLKSKPPTGKTFVYIECDLIGCPGTAQGLAAATKVVGWNLKVLNYSSANPASLVAAMKEALQYHPVAVGFSGLGENLWASEVPAYQAAGVAIIPFAAAPVTIDNTVIASLGGTTDNTHYGKMVASWFIATSDGKGHALLVNVPGFQILQSFVSGFNQAVAQWCPGCKVTTIDESIPAASNGSLVPATVSALQRDPSIDYAVTVYGPFFDGLPAALSAAGISSRVKLAGQGGDVINLTSIKSGKNDGAYTANPFVIAGWSMVDRAARHLEGMAIDQGATLPTQLLATGQDFPLTSQYLYPSDYAAQFEKLWQVAT
jgi:ribose transport system substrate-binding protein